MYNSYHFNQSILRNVCIVFTLVISTLLPGKALATGIDFQVKNVTVREAVLKLQQQYGFSVTVESNEVDMNRKVSVSARNESSMQYSTVSLRGRMSPIR